FAFCLVSAPLFAGIHAMEVDQARTLQGKLSYLPEGGVQLFTLRQLLCLQLQKSVFAPIALDGGYTRLNIRINSLTR
ncbi:MAG: hypothetical protein P8104_10020, partial [Gammaproteobacteria bacterium]